MTTRRSFFATLLAPLVALQAVVNVPKKYGMSEIPKAFLTRSYVTGEWELDFDEHYIRPAVAYYGAQAAAEWSLVHWRYSK